MSRYRTWLKTLPLWQFVLFQAVTGGVGLVLAVELLLRLLSPGSRLSPWIAAGWLVFMTPFYIWQGKHRNGTA
jgi:hypothetical protein